MQRVLNMDFRLQAFRVEMDSKNSGVTYRFAVVDYSKSHQYPSNFVCMLPLKVDKVKGKNLNVFGGLFGDKCVDFARELLNKALVSERDVEVKMELERRLKLLEPKHAGEVECFGCKKTFETTKMKKYKHPFCEECYSKRFSRKS
jgi:hypothetical protein